jgi:hypothetical protein
MNDKAFSRVSFSEANDSAMKLIGKIRIIHCRPPNTQFVSQLYDVQLRHLVLRVYINFDLFELK